MGAPARETCFPGANRSFAGRSVIVPDIAEGQDRDPNIPEDKSRQQKENQESPKAHTGYMLTADWGGKKARRPRSNHFFVDAFGILYIQCIDSRHCGPRGVVAGRKDKKKKKDRQLVIRVNAGERDAFVTLCEALDTSASREIRRFMKRFIAECEAARKRKE